MSSVCYYSANGDTVGTELRSHRDTLNMTYFRLLCIERSSPSLSLVLLNSAVSRNALSACLKCSVIINKLFTHNLDPSVDNNLDNIF